MTNIGQAVTQNAQDLTTLLEAVKSKMESIAKSYPLLDQASEDSVEFSELKRLISLCESSHDDIHCITDRTRQLTKPRTKGKLVLGSDGKYRLDTDDHMFSCNSPIEVFIDSGYDHGWQFGRMEHRESMGGYYFRSYSCDDHRLYEGMLAAVRD